MKYIMNAKISCNSFLLSPYRITEASNPLRLGRYEKVRAKNLALYKVNLREQIAADTHRRGIVQILEKENDKLRDECTQLQRQKADADRKKKTHKVFQNINNEREISLLNNEKKRVLIHY